MTSKPVLICAVDNSRSITAAKDSTLVKNIFSNNYNSTLNKLKENFTVHSFLFGEEIIESETPDFKDNSTNISSLLMYANRLYDKNSIDAMLLITDGIYTTGFNPTLIAEENPYPIYTVGIGDTTSINDYSIVNIRYNDEVYIQSNCVFEANISATGFNKEELVLQIFDNNKLISTRNIKIDNDIYHSTLDIVFPPESPGKHFYKFILTGNKDDEIKNNNEKTCVVNVIDTKKHILIISKGAHPDINALKQA
ncbi:hypothetical protein LJC25_05370, partial [Bacteroidales bacterium OttesenSCG-928-K03]|nr:hypothetical protein [Bacteroidales bacterium OttesenSCG-928-K03]